jgi:hypothetical protein
MYICEDCGHTTESPTEIEEYHGDYNYRPEIFYQCPNCDSDRIEEAERCECCGSDRPVSQMTGDICDECLKVWRDHFYTMMRDKYTPQELEWIYLAMDGEPLDPRDAVRRDRGAA